ncbi:MAG TPA: DoxX family protein [Mycobacteriales bacterium]|nr:DoxX family protein [Mycobacteriales bacterium]
MPEGLFIIRLVLGLLLFAHGTQKLLGWFGGYGLEGTGGFFESVGHKPGRLMAMVAGLSEAVGGLFLVLGFLTPWAAAMVMGTMLVAAVSVHAPHGLWATNGGYELPLVNGLVACGLAFTGAGSWSLDHAFDIPWTRGWGVGIGAIVVALIAALLVLGRRRTIADSEVEPAYPAEATPVTTATEDVAARSRPL